MTEAEKLRFSVCIRENLSKASTDGESIGTYKEKRLHRILKSYFEPDESFQEIKVGEYIADIKRENEIIEIQTGSFFPMENKLKYYLENTEFNVTVVRPIPHIKWCVWIDPDVGEIVSKRKSGKKYLPKDTLRDWYSISELLGKDRLKLVFLLLEEEEYRYLCGRGKDRKRGSRRYERIPIDVIDKVEFSAPEDYLSLLPDSLGDSFKATDFMKAAKITSYCAYSALNILCKLSFLEKEKVGRGYMYHRIT